MDIKNKLSLSEEEYYKMVELDVNEWRIRSTNLSFTQLQKIKAKQLYDEGNSVHEIAEEMRTVARNVSETLKGYGIKPNVVKKQFQKNTRTPELEQKIIRLYELGLSAAHICVETEYNFRTPKSITDILKKYGRKMQEQKELELHVNSTIFNFIDTEEKAYWLGLLITDGWVYKKGGSHTIGISLEEKDKYLMEEFKKFLGTPNKLLSKESKNIKGETRRCWTLMVNSKQLFEDLKKYGVIERKSSNTNPKLELIPKDLQHHFWRGCFDGDGCYYYNSGDKLTFCYTGTIDIVYKFLSWLYHEAGTREFKTPYKKNMEAARARGENANVVMYDFQFSHADDIKIIREALYRDATIYMKRKYELSNIERKAPKYLQHA